MKIFKIVLISIAVLLGLLIVVGLFLPDKMKVDESIVIDTPANVPYSQITNLKNMTKWDPWSNLDTNMEVVYTGPLAGLGAKRTWKSKNKQVGSGSMAIIKDEPYKYIETELDFGSNGKATSYFKFEKIANNKTKVTWGFQSDVDIPVLGGYLTIMMTPIIEKEYIKGLKKLKSVSENMSNKSDLTNRNISIENVSSQEIICIANSSSFNDKELDKKISKAFGQLVSNIQINKMQMIGKPLTITTKWEENSFEFENCIPVQNIKGDLSASVFKSKTYSGTAVKIEHIGSYKNLKTSYDDIMAYISQMHFDIVDNSWEVYISDPSNTPEDKLITYIYFPIK